MAEVERALGVLDGAVLVLSAVEGVQPHTRLLMRTCRALRLPTLLFVNKVDRTGARSAALLADIRRLLTPAIAPLGTVRGLGTRAASFVPGATDGWLPVLAEHDDTLLAAFVSDQAVPSAALWAALRDQTAAGLVHPLLFGSALSGTGVPALLDAIGDLLPASPPAEPEPRARVFAITRGPGGAKVAYARAYGGTLAARQRVQVFRTAPDGQVASHRAQLTAVSVVGDPTAPALTAGYIAALHGLPAVRIGDQVGSGAGLAVDAHFPRPSLETVVRRRDGGEASALHAALLRMADEDPLIHTSVTASGESSVRLYGEVQKEVIATTLADAGILADFAPSQLIHLERPTGTGTAVEIIGNGFFGTVGLRVEPGKGIEYGLEVELGSLPLSYHKAIEESVVQALEQGLRGWPVTDVRVTLTHSGYWSQITVAGDFRDLTPHVLLQALAKAGTRVFEPCHHFEADIPAAALGPVTGALAHLGGRVDETLPIGETWRVGGSIPARLVAEAQRRLPNLTNGEGLWTSTPAGDRPVEGRPPRRARTDGNPLDRREYTRWLAQRDLAGS